MDINCPAGFGQDHIGARHKINKLRAVGGDVVISTRSICFSFKITMYNLIQNLLIMISLCMKLSFDVKQLN